MHSVVDHQMGSLKGKTHARLLLKMAGEALSLLQLPSILVCFEHAVSKTLKFHNQLKYLQQLQHKVVILV